MSCFGPYFTEEELGVTNAPDEVKEQMFLLVQLVLNPIRKKFGPIIITSGYRSPEHNAKIGGVNTSQHITGQAVDFIAKNVPTREVFEWLREFYTGQCIYYSQRKHCHISLPTRDLHIKQRLYSFIDDKK